MQRLRLTRQLVQKIGQPRPWQAGAEPFIESFNSRLRDECLNGHVFLSLTEARATIEAWRLDYNQRRPHSSLGALTPAEFATLKGPDTQPPQEGETTGGLYL